MDGVVKNDAACQHEPEHASRRAGPCEATDPQTQQCTAPNPNRLQPDRSRWNRPLFAVLPVELHIERIVEKHAAGIQRSRASEQIRQLIDVARASEPPTGEAI